MFIVGYKCMYRALCKLVYLNKMCAFACTNIVVLQDELSTIKKLAVAISTLSFSFFCTLFFWYRVSSLPTGTLSSGSGVLNICFKVAKEFHLMTQ